MKRPARRPTRPAVKTAGPVKALRILVVENHPDMRRGLEVFLLALGYHPRFADNITEALAMAGASAPFDLLLSDIHLPDGSGWDLPGLLARSGHGPAHAIAMSGFGSLEDVEKSRVAGFRLHLVKPGTPGELEAALHEVAAL